MYCLVQSSLMDLLADKPEVASTTLQMYLEMDNEI